MRLLAALALLLATPLAAETRSANHLLGASSPYLQQHIYNSVDWHPWGDAALEKAAREARPIFLSVGYSACHWCRVMADESFDNPEIGAFLNAHFVAIKIDREERPDLDEQFILVTQTASGTSGWPNSVFLTPDAKPFYGGGYFPPNDFLALLQDVQSLWQQDKNSILAEAEALNTVVTSYLNRKALARPFTPTLANAVSARLLAQVDPFYGGFGVAPKFPQETRLFYMLDQAERTGDEALLRAVEATMLGMVNGAIHDHVGGGFHRYSVDNAWAIPHFEKMLYNQALISQLLLRLDQLRPNPAFARAAERTFAYTLRDLAAPMGGFYSAQDADSLAASGEHHEGIFYTWTPAQIQQALGDDAATFIAALSLSEVGNFEGANTLSLAEFSGDQTGFPLIFDRLLQARSSRNPPLTDQKILMGWNAEMIISLTLGAAHFENPAYLTTAQNTARFMMDTMRNGEGYFRASTEGTAQIPAQLPDYASFGRALIALHDADPDGGWLQEAERITHYVLERFQETNGLFRMVEQPDGLGVFVQLDDSEIPSGNAQMLSLLSAISQRTTDITFIQHAHAMADLLSGAALTQPEQRAAALAAVDSHNRGALGQVRALSNGAVRVRALPNRTENRIRVSIELAAGWHINAHTPLEPYLIPTSVAVNGEPLPKNAFPEPLVTHLAFNQSTPLALYLDEVDLTAPLSPGANVVDITVQACSDEVCLAPETLTFRFW